jgi:hypothetical protein
VQSDPTMLLGPAQGDTDRPGMDIANFVPPEANPAMCEESCAGNAACKAWTYVAPGTTQGPQPHCWLKGGMPLQQAAACCTSGLKIAVQPANMTPIQGAFDRLGSDFADFDLPVSDPRLCQGECAENGTCQAWAYLVPGKNPPHCWLKSAKPGVTANEACSSGAKK